jgi:hypothetical protein
MLESIADEERGTVLYSGVRYHYSEDDTWAGLFYSGDSDALPVRFYEFESNKGLSLTIEAWVDDADVEREAFLSRELNVKNITVLNKGE